MADQSNNASALDDILSQFAQHEKDLFADLAAAEDLNDSAINSNNNNIINDEREESQFNDSAPPIQPSSSTVDLLEDILSSVSSKIQNIESIMQKKARHIPTKKKNPAKEDLDFLSNGPALAPSAYIPNSGDNLRNNVDKDSADSSAPASAADNQTKNSASIRNSTEPIIAQGEINPLYDRNYRPSFVSPAIKEQSASEESTDSTNSNGDNERKSRSESTIDNVANNSTPLTWSQKMLNNQNVRKERRGSISGVTIGGLRSSNGIVIRPSESTEVTENSSENTVPVTNTQNTPTESEQNTRDKTDVPSIPLRTEAVDNTAATSVQPQTSPRELGTSPQGTTLDKRASTRFLASRPSISSRNVAIVRQISNRSMTVSDPLRLEPAPMARPSEVSRGTGENSDVTRDSFGGELMNKFEQLNITFKIPSVADQLRMPVSRSETIESVKVSLYQEVIKKHKLLGTESEYVLRAEDDDYWTDENLIFMETPYIEYCLKEFEPPLIYFVPRVEQELVQQEISDMIGVTVPHSIEINDFRASMRKTMSSVFRTTFRRTRQSMAQFTPTMEKIYSKHLPQEFKLLWYLPQDDLSVSKAVDVKLLASCEEVLSAIFEAAPSSFPTAASARDFILKVRGIDEYLTSSMLLISLPYIRDALRKRRELAVVVYHRNFISEDVREYLRNAERVKRRRGNVEEISPYKQQPVVQTLLTNTRAEPLASTVTAQQPDATPVEAQSGTEPAAGNRKSLLSAADVSELLAEHSTHGTSPLSTSPGTGVMESTVPQISTTEDEPTQVPNQNTEATLTGTETLSTSPSQDSVALSTSPVTNVDADSGPRPSTSPSQSVSAVSAPNIPTLASLGRNTTLPVFDSLVSDGRRESFNVNMNYTNQLTAAYSSWALEQPLMLRMKRLEPFTPDQLKALKLNKKSLPDAYVSFALYCNGQILNLRTQPIIPWTLKAEDEANFCPSEWVSLGSYTAIPWSAVLHVQVRTVSNKKTTLIAWCNMRVFDYRGLAFTGPQSHPLWIGGDADVMAPLLEVPDGPKVHFEVESYDYPVMFPNIDLHDEVLKSPLEDQHYEALPRNILPRLQELINTDPLYRPSDEEKQMLWRFRSWCKTQPKAVAKFLLSVPWGDPLVSIEVYSLLQQWVDIEPIDALELLNHNFSDKFVREFAVYYLQRLSDDELQQVLLQLVQALKHEYNHDSMLARFLIIKAVFNQTQLGHYFFWLMKACLSKVSPYRERYAVVLEVYLRFCGRFRQDLKCQCFLYNKLTDIATSLKTVKDKKKALLFLREQLETLQFQLPEQVQIPIDSNLIGTKFIVDKCKYLDSKTLPLWLVFQNADSLGDPIHVLFKVGDDLRQDQLTLQMFRLMDQMWLNEGLDLKMSPYHCVETGNETGMIEVVLNAETTAGIQKQYGGGFKAAFSEKPLQHWLRKHNPDDADYKMCVKDFIRSCAGYCVATYVLGIGDRHNDNIMCTTKGHMFHIDFGRFLGNVEKFGAINRDRAPFVFTPEFAYVMGGTEHALFKWFVALCCKAYNILRKRANVFINLFAMMISTGIPELRTEKDIDYLREAFSLNLNDEQAVKKFETLIWTSLKTKFQQWNNALHIMAHPGKEKKEKEKEKDTSGLNKSQSVNNLNNIVQNNG
eukprot:TRINITY_DN3889_c0_g1_i1.p1 TRINITY_DN3889_c0_g1~~TRINITY_DN3889_c0_g1_i1.p1  ORF type:complete len:1634 (-),score=443.27 TRINITY_DN3889_c0_g1_i1:6-4907(-)